jgi:hypothetical protein
LCLLPQSLSPCSSCLPLAVLQCPHFTFL